MNLQEKIIGIPPAGCAVLAYFYFDIDMGEAAHGRGAALATGMKRALPDRVVFTYQGDGDIAAIGTAETIHAAARGENFSTIFVNNGVYGMTGGQMAPTTILGQNTTTSPGGRKEKEEMGFRSTSVKCLPLPRAAPISKGQRSIAPPISSGPKGDCESLSHSTGRTWIFAHRGLISLPHQLEDGVVGACKWIDEVMAVHFPLGRFKGYHRTQKRCSLRRSSLDLADRG